MIAYHNNPSLKESALARMREHREADKLVQGYGYWKDSKGCAVGCLIHSSDHSQYETQFGIPLPIARLEDGIFEGLDRKLAIEWPERFLDAIPVGADLSMVWPGFALWLLRDSGFLRVTTCNKSSIDAVISLYAEWVESGVKPAASRFHAYASASAYAAADAAADAYASASAYAAADAAAAYAYASASAYAAADAAADAYASASAYAAADAAAAARKAAWRLMADKLVELLSHAPQPPQAAESRAMSENCPKCGANRTLFEGQTSWECGSYQSVIGGSHIHRPQFKLIEGAHCICRQQLAALTQRAEQAERERDRLRELSQKQQGEIEDIGYMADAVERLREIANATGCDHVDDSDGRLQLVSCVEQVIWSAECKAETAEAEVKRLREEVDDARIYITTEDGSKLHIRNLIRCGLRSLQKKRGVFWGSVAEAFGVGSTSAHRLCRFVNLDPDSGELTEEISDAQ